MLLACGVSVSNDCVRVFGWRNLIECFDLGRFLVFSCQFVVYMQNAPPGFIIVQSRSRPGEVSYWSKVLGQRFSSLELAHLAHKKLIQTSDLVIPEDEVVVEPDFLSPHGPPLAGSGRTFWQESERREGVPFTDSEFPPAATSIGKTSEEDPSSRLRITPAERDGAQWVRLPDFIRRANRLDSSAPIELFGSIEPNDLTQGIVGDCWLLATLACLAEFPNTIESLFEPSAVEDGEFKVRLFDLDTREWKTITIDDHIPCKWEDDYSEVPFRVREDGVRVYDGRVAPGRRLQPLFAVPNGNQMWAALLEKAVAKFVGSYAALAGGHEPFAMIAFTGFPQVYQFKRLPVNEQKSIAKLGEWERGWAQWASKFSPSCGYRPILDEDEKSMTDESLWKRLLEYDRMNYLLAASIVCYESLVPPRPDGLVVGHAYSFLAAEEFGPVRLVKLRNPHGKGTPAQPTEWRGAWSDDAPEWPLHPNIAAMVGHENVHDGIFWMSFSDFAKTFDKLLVLPYPMSAPRGALSSIRRAKIRASFRTAAANAKLGMTMENLAHVSGVVKAVHLMSVHPYDPYLNAPDWVRADPAAYTRWAHEKLGTQEGGDIGGKKS